MCCSTRISAAARQARRIEAGAHRIDGRGRQRRDHPGVLDGSHIPIDAPGGPRVDLLPEGSYESAALNAIFAATVDATEEAVMNALLAATTMRGRDGHNAPCAVPHDRLRALLT